MGLKEKVEKDGLKSEGFEKELFVQFGGSKTVCVSANLGRITEERFRDLDLDEKIEKFNDKASDYELHPPEIDYLRWDKSSKSVWVTFTDDADVPYDRQDYYADAKDQKPKSERDKELGVDGSSEREDSENGSIEVEREDGSSEREDSTNGKDDWTMVPFALKRDESGNWYVANALGEIISESFDKKSGDGNSVRNALETHFEIDGFSGMEEKDDHGNKMYQIRYETTPSEEILEDVEWLTV